MFKKGDNIDGLPDGAFVWCCEADMRRLSQLIYSARGFLLFFLRTSLNLSTPLKILVEFKFIYDI